MAHGGFFRRYRYMYYKNYFWKFELLRSWVKLFLAKVTFVKVVCLIKNFHNCHILINHKNQKKIINPGRFRINWISQINNKIVLHNFNAHYIYYHLWLFCKNYIWTFFSVMVILLYLPQYSHLNFFLTSSYYRDVCHRYHIWSFFWH